MAPLSASDIIRDLGISSLELDARSTTLDEIISKALPAQLHKRDGTTISSPSEVFHTLTARDGAVIKTPDHGGAVDPTNINMKGIQALIAIIGASFVVAIIWFFFWAKNGGFQWRKGDWDDYKSTVLRRKGPNGTTLSNATKSTRLGGGSVVGEGFSDGSASTTDGTMTETMTDMSSEAPIMREKGMRETAKDRKIREVREANWEGGHDDDMRAYIHEKPARVGGINKDSEALHYGTDYTDTEGSAIYSNRQSRSYAPRVVPSSSRQASPEKRPARRDFSYGNDEGFSAVSSSQPEVPLDDFQQTPASYPEIPPPAPPHRPGRYHSPSKQFNQPQQDPRRSGQYSRSNTPGNFQEPSVVSVQSQNTKAYHHPLPALNNPSPVRGNNNQSPVRGYRRDRRDSLDD